MPPLNCAAPIRRAPSSATQRPVRRAITLKSTDLTTSACPTRKVLGRRSRETTIEDLPDDVIVKIIRYALQMNPRRPGEISRRVRPRFRTTGQAIALVSRRINALLKQSVTAIELSATAPYTWLKAMLIFAKDSLQLLNLTSQGKQDSSSLCLMLASTAPPITSLTLTSLAGAPFEHVVAMLRALPLLKECDIQHPRPVDLAAIAHACPPLQILSLGPVRHQREVDEIRRQFTSLIVSPIGKRLVSLNMPWCCATNDAFDNIRRYCGNLQRFGAEFGAIHWIRHRAFKAGAPVEVDLGACAKEQHTLFRSMLRAVGHKHNGKLASFGLRTLDGIPSTDLELIFSSLRGLEELDLFVGSATNPMLCPDRSFNRLTKTLSKTLQRVNIVGLRFTPEQVDRFSLIFPQLDSVSIWMGKKERPSLKVFESFGQRIKHLSILCDWNEPMCEAVGKHNTNLESLFLATKRLPLSSIESLLIGTRFTLNEFRLFFNKENGEDEENIWNPINGPGLVVAAQGLPAEEAGPERTEANGMVMDAARMVVKDCAATLEVLNICAACGRGRWFVDCTDIAKELTRSAPHLWQICDAYFMDT